MKKQTFDIWLSLVDDVIEAKLGLSMADLPDCCYHDWYEDGVAPKSAANRAIKAAQE